MRLDYGYRKNVARGFVHRLSVSRAPAACKLLAYTADHIGKRAAFAKEFTAGTDVQLQPERNERHRFVQDPLRDVGIESMAMGAFAAWVPKRESVDAVANFE
jgi:hypothetical protein